jgi:hypothetical protein
MVVILDSRQVREGLADIPSDQYVNVSCLYLQGEKLDRRNAKRLVSFLQKFGNTVTQLKLACSLQKDDGTPEIMGNFLRHTKHIESITFRGLVAGRDSLDEGTIKFINCGLRENESVKHIGFAHLDFGGLLCQISLRNFLLRKTNIQRLEFIFCGFGFNKTCSGLVHGLAAQDCLQELVITSHSLSDNAAAAVIKALNYTGSSSDNNKRKICLHKLQLLGDLDTDSLEALLAFLANKTTILEELIVPREFFSCHRQKLVRHSSRTLRRLITQTLLVKMAGGPHPPDDSRERERRQTTKKR